MKRSTIKFEKGYNEWLIGKYPDEKEVFIERSPLNKAHLIKCPIIFFHGGKDAVVPLEHSKTIYEIVKQNGVPTSFVTFPGYFFHL